MLGEPLGRQLNPGHDSQLLKFLKVESGGGLSAQLALKAVDLHL